MGLFDFFRRRTRDRVPAAAAAAVAPSMPAPPLTSDQLRDAIVDAHTRQDGDRLQQLFTAYGEQISRDCMIWTKCPDDRTGDREWVNRYIQALGWLCDVMKSNGDARLYDALVGTDESNPLLRWDRVLEQSQAVFESAEAEDFDRAIAQLEDILIETRTLSGPGMEQYVPITHGRLGILCFGRGRIELARGHFETALRQCREYGDGEGVRTYLRSLYEVHRYLGDAARAADFAIDLAAALEQNGERDEAARMRRQADLVRAGEPLLRMIARIGERRYEADEVTREMMPQDTPVQFVFERNRLPLRLAENITRRGEQLGAQSKYYEAIADFRAAAELDPHAPQPHYQEGFSLMHLERHAEAADAYATCERLAPGWFNCRADLFLAGEMAGGRWPHPVFVALTLEDAGPEILKPAEKLGILNRAAEMAPDLARIHLVRGKTFESMDRNADAETACRAGLAIHDRDADTRSWLFARLGVLADAPQKKRDLLRQAIDAEPAGGSLMAATMSMLMLRTTT